MLEINGLYAGYGPVDVLTGIELSTKGAGICAVLGPNGSGKTTLVRSITGQMRARRGRVSFNGDDISSYKPHQIAARGVATVPQGRGIFEELSVQENLLMGAFVQGHRGDLDDRLGATHNRFPILRERARQPAGSLSGGEQMMLAVARAMLSHPKLLLLDEPSEGLGPKVVHGVFADIERFVSEEGGAVLLVEQNLRQTLAVADRIFVLVQGRIVASGPPDEFRSPEELMRLYLSGRSSEAGERGGEALQE
jgi:branched-chain amino acid transport system ATP-binding protein